MRMIVGAALILALGLAACGKKDEAASPSVAPAPNSSNPAAAMGALAGGESSAPMKAYTADLTKIATAVAAVKDDASAKQAAEVIGQLNPELNNLVKQLDGMSDADKAAAMTANMQELVAAQQKIAVAMSNLQMNSPNLMATLAEQLGKMPQMKTN